MTDVKRTERGWAGHYICADKCLFRRNTLLEYNGVKVVVSTIGNQMNKDGDIEEVGFLRYFETKAFYAEKSGEYTDADWTREIYLSSPCSIGDYKTPGVDNLANDMHEAAVAEIVCKLLDGTIKDDATVTPCPNCGGAMRRNKGGWTCGKCE
jgi:hypothetical protein